MLTSDLALLHDPIYSNISQVYLANFTKLTDDFSRACKSCHARHRQPLHGCRS